MGGVACQSRGAAVRRRRRRRASLALALAAVTVCMLGPPGGECLETNSLTSLTGDSGSVPVPWWPKRVFSFFSSSSSSSSSSDDDDTDKSLTPLRHSYPNAVKGPPAGEEDSDEEQESEEEEEQPRQTSGQGQTGGKRKVCSPCGKPSNGGGGGGPSTSVWWPWVPLRPSTTTPPPPPPVVWLESTSEHGGLDVSVEERGGENTREYSMFYRNEDGPISPFHDIPLFANEGNKIFNMVVEVPRWTNAKMEIATKEPLNPIKQDVKKGKLRYVANVFPHHGYIWNYGALPQTWEDPNHVDKSTGCKGDNDPIDVCEIGYRVAKRGEVIQVKVLGILALIDEGETDWKLIAIDVNDPMAPQLSDISDVEKHMPGYLKATVEWFRVYKIPDGKPENQFAFNGMAQDREFAHKIIMETYEAWQKLVEGKSDAGGLSIGCVTIENAAERLSQQESQDIVNSAPEPAQGQPIDPKVDLWHFISLK